MLRSDPKSVRAEVSATLLNGIPPETGSAGSCPTHNLVSRTVYDQTYLDTTLVGTKEQPAPTKNADHPFWAVTLCGPDFYRVMVHCKMSSEEQVKSFMQPYLDGQMNGKTIQSCVPEST